MRSFARAKAQESSKAKREQGHQPNGIQYQEGRGRTGSGGAITISSVSPRGNVGNPVPTVRAKVEAEGANLSKHDIRLYLDGAEQRRFYYGMATGNLSYHPGMLSSGSHTVEIVATSGQGSSTSKKSWTFSVS
jgi:hypothetical protein